MNAVDIGCYLRLLACIGIVGVVLLLHLLLAREWVKSDLRARGFRPVRVRWWPWTLWPFWGPAFRVCYADADGSIHQALCGVCGWHRPVRWRNDRVLAAA